MGLGMLTVRRTVGDGVESSGKGVIVHVRERDCIVKKRNMIQSNLDKRDSFMREKA
jgi:hypothetical protein